MGKHIFLGNYKAFQEILAILNHISWIIEKSLNLKSFSQNSIQGLFQEPLHQY